MCLSVPAKVISIEGDMARVSIGNSTVNASLQLVEDVKVGDYILLHTGFAIEVINEEQAKETLKLLSEIMDRFENPKE